MIGISQHSPLAERQGHLLSVISGQRFLKMLSLGNEVPFFICPFKVKESADIEVLQKQLVNQLANQGIQVLEVNLYDLSVDLLKKRGLWEQILENEPLVSKNQLKELLQGVLDTESHIIPAIREKISAQEHSVLFITGVGEVYPYIRSHNVLNNLQSTAKDKPTVMFFPGEYTHSIQSGASLDLFGKLHDDKYYRAFNIFHCEP